MSDPISLRFAVGSVLELTEMTVVSTRKDGYADTPAKELGEPRARTWPALFPRYGYQIPSIAGVAIPLR